MTAARLIGILARSGLEAPHMNRGAANKPAHGCRGHSSAWFTPWRNGSPAMPKTAEGYLPALHWPKSTPLASGRPNPP